jgi:hypothetical protein
MRARQIVGGACVIAAPLLQVAGWILLAQAEGEGPTLGWAVSHGLLFAAVVLLIPASLAFRHLLRGRVGEGWRDLGPALVVVGALATAGNFTIDLVAWQLAATQAEMNTLFTRVRSSLPLAVAFYSVGPGLLPLGMLVQLLSLVRARVVARWLPALAALGVVIVAVGQTSGSDTAVVAGYVVVLLGLAPIGWRIMRGRTEVGGHASTSSAHPQLP